MLKKTSRLSREAFEVAFKGARRMRVRGAQVLKAPSPTTQFHASVVVSKKVAPRAVARNALRRRVYARLRTLALAHSLVDVIIVILLPEARTLPLPTLLSAVEEGALSLSKKSSSR